MPRKLDEIPAARLGYVLKGGIPKFQVSKVPAPTTWPEITLSALRPGAAPLRSSFAWCMDKLVSGA